MLFSKVNDKKIRSRYNLIEHKKKVNKFILINLFSKINFNKKKNKKKFYIFKSIALKKTKEKTYKNRIVSHCLFSYRTRSVNKNLRLSRSILRDLIQFGLVPGYKKAVW